MKTNFKFLFLIGITLFPSCENDKVNVKKSGELIDFDKDHCQSLLIITEDRSGSTSDIRKLSKEDYQKIFDIFNEKFNGEIALRVIGNPVPKEKQFFTLEMEAGKPLFYINDSDKMSIKGKYRRLNDSINIYNNQIKESNQKKALDFLDNIVEANILNYIPDKHKDITNIKDALNHITTKIEEPTYKNFKNIFVLIISDGKHDAEKIKEKIKFNEKRDIKLFLVGWKDLTVFDSINDKNIFESPEGFINYFKTIKCIN